MPALRVLYVADRWDGPYRWRCRHAVEQLRLDGVPANTMHVDDPALLDGLASYSVVVLFRLPWRPRVATVVARARGQGARLVFDIDDLVFEPGAERLLPFFGDLPAVTQAEYLALFPRLRQTLEACDVVVGATPVLARHAARAGARAFVHPNLLGAGALRLGRVLGALARRVRRPPIIAYVSGSNTHDRDLAMVSEPLAQVLAEGPQVRLLLCGYVGIPAPLERFQDRIIRLPYQDWRAYPFALATCRVSIAPLAVQNDFTDAKSALKYLEAGAVGVPTIASPSEPFRAAIRDGDTGFLATTEAEWTERLRAALDAAGSRRLGSSAHRDVRARFTFAARRGQLAALLGDLGGHASGPAPPALSIELEPGSGGLGVRRRLGLARRQWALFRGTAASLTPDEPHPGVVHEPTSGTARQTAGLERDASA
jgi:glycosyltransferase involved in cell wall biosynthesis